MAQLADTSLFYDAQLMAYYKLEDANDNKGSANLTNNGSIPFNAAKYNNGGDLGAGNTTDYFSQATNLGIAGNGDASFSFWIKLQTEISSGSYAFISFDSNAGADRYFRLEYQYNSGTRRLQVDAAAGGTPINYNITLGTTNFYHIAVTRNVSGNATKLYVNGALVGTGDIGTGTGFPNVLEIGRNPAGGGVNYASAIFDDLGVFGRVLTVTEVGYLSQATNPDFTFLDKTANGNNLTNNAGASEVNTSLPFIQSKEAVNTVSATSQFLSATDSATLKPAGNFTIEAWIKTSSASRQTIFQSRSVSGTVAGFMLATSVTTAGKLYGVSGKNTGTSGGTDFQEVESTGSVNDGAWHHVALVYNGSTLKLYIDAVEDGSVAWANAAGYAATNYPRVGCENQSGSNINFFNGNIDEVRLWSVARTPTEIATYKGVELKGTETGLNAYWPFENTLGGTGGFFRLM